MNVEIVCVNCRPIGIIITHQADTKQWRERRSPPSSSIALSLATCVAISTPDAVMHLVDKVTCRPKGV